MGGKIIVIDDASHDVPIRKLYACIIQLKTVAGKSELKYLIEMYRKVQARLSRYLPN